MCISSICFGGNVLFFEYLKIIRNRLIPPYISNLIKTSKII